MKKILTILILAFTFGLLSFGSIGLATVNAQSSTGEICTGAGLTSSGGKCQTQAGAPTISGIVKAIINVMSLILGVIAVIMIIVGGFKFITSGGDTNSVASAKNTIMFALIGLVVAALAQVLVHYVLTIASSSS
jgi:hypothetical protein